MTSGLQKLHDYGTLPDSGLPLVETALLVAMLRHPGRSPDSYRNHIEKLRRQVAERHADLLEAGAEDTPETRIAAVKHVVSDMHGYAGDDENYNDLRNADLMEVIDRRKGLPISLALIALDAALAQGWDVKGINFPGHFLLRFDQDGKRVLSDPYNGFSILQAPDLRRILKSTLGPQAELSASLYKEASNREILLRLQNNIKYRQIEGEDYRGALETVTYMRAFSPAEHRLLLDESVLEARLGHVERAILRVREYLASSLTGSERHDAQVLLRTLENMAD